MIYCRGNKLRAPTLHLCEYLAPTDKSRFSAIIYHSLLGNRLSCLRGKSGQRRMMVEINGDRRQL